MQYIILKLLTLHTVPKTLKTNMADGCYDNTAHAWWPTYIDDDEIINLRHHTSNFDVKLQMLSLRQVPFSNYKNPTGCFRKSSPLPKTFWNIFTSVKSYCVKFCKFVGNSYPHICQFLSRVSTLTRDIDIAILSVRPSVCPLRSGIRWKRFNIVIVFTARCYA